MRAASAALAVAALVLLGAGSRCFGEAAVQDYRTFIGVARGTGEVVLSPGRGFRFSSKAASDLAFALTSAPLPATYRITLTVGHVDIYSSGCTFGIYGGAVRSGGDNNYINSLTKYAVFFNESRGARQIYLWYFDQSGNYYCWDGRTWCKNLWRPTGGVWTTQQSYALVLEKNASAFVCEIRAGADTLVRPPAVPVTSIRKAGEPDYFAFGDLVTDYVYGDLAVSSLAIEEVMMEPYLSSDMERILIRKAPEGRYAMYGGLKQLPDGELFCVYKVGSLDKETGSPWTVRDETIVWTRSSNHGRTWPQTENLIYKDSATRQETCSARAYLSAKGVLMHPFDTMNPDYEEEARESNWSKVHLATSTNMGETWQFRQLDAPLSIAAAYGGIHKLSDGTLLMGVYGAAERGSFRHQSGLLRSRDEGETWSDYTIVGKNADADGGPARLNETDFVAFPNGRLLSLSRTQYEGYPLYRGFSEDKGHTWSVSPSGLTGLCPSLCFSPVGPPEGVVVIAYHDRWGKHATKGGVYVAFSYDHGRTWGEPMWISDGAYPCIIETDPGVMFCSYYESASLLRATIFRVPFPSGLRAHSGVAGPSACGVRVEWDEYSGRRATAYSYRIYRSATTDVAVKKENLVATARKRNIYDDLGLEAGRMYFYKVAAYEGKREVGVSWTAAARAGSSSP